jgi:hypothetical protein
MAVGGSLVALLLAVTSIDSDLPIYAGLGASLLIYVTLSLVPARAAASPG